MGHLAAKRLVFLVQREIVRVRVPPEEAHDAGSNALEARALERKSWNSNSKKLSRMFLGIVVAWLFVILQVGCWTAALYERGNTHGGQGKAKASFYHSTEAGKASALK